MSLNNLSMENSSIELREIILTAWKDKVIIISCSLILMLVGYIYGAYKPKIYQTTISLHDISEIPFGKFSYLINSKSVNQEYNISILSVDNLTNFFIQNENLDEFKVYLKKNNIVTRKYFLNRIKNVSGKNNNPLKYTFTFLPPLSGEDFLNDYVVFTKNNILNKQKKQIIKKIENEIEILKENLEIAEKLDIDFKTGPKFDFKNLKLQPEHKISKLESENDNLFYLGKSVINFQLKKKEKLLKDMNEFNFNFNPFIDKASEPILISKSPVFYMTIAFFSGLFLSLIIILFKIILRK